MPVQPPCESNTFAWAFWTSYACRAIDLLDYCEMFAIVLSLRTTFPTTESRPRDWLHAMKAHKLRNLRKIRHQDLVRQQIKGVVDSIDSMSCLQRLTCRRSLVLLCPW